MLLLQERLRGFASRRAWPTRLLVRERPNASRCIGVFIGRQPRVMRGAGGGWEEGQMLASPCLTQICVTAVHLYSGNAPRRQRQACASFERLSSPVPLSSVLAISKSLYVARA